MSIAGELARFLVATGAGDLPLLALERARMVSVEASLEVIHEFETVKAMAELVRLLT